MNRSWPRIPRQPLMSGEIQIIFGPMFSGKSTELIRRVRRYDIAGHDCLMVKYARDNRYSQAEEVVTHDRNSWKAVSTEKLGNICEEKVQNCSVIGIDEGQFFSDVVEFSEKMANQGKVVIVAALDGTFERKGFNNILNLVPYAESVVKLSAVCNYCKCEAHFTKRTSDDTEVEVIGSQDKYMATCRACYMKPRTPSSGRGSLEGSDKEN